MNRGRPAFAAVVGLLMFGVLWEVYVRVANVRRFILLPPSEIVSELRARPGLYLDASLVTARHAAVGLFLALVVAVALGALLATSRFLENAVQPILVLVLVAPWVAYFSPVVAWLGRGDPPVLFLVSLVALPAFTFATVTCLRSSDPAARELLASVDASRLEVLWRLRLPSALPSLFSTARYAFGLALAASYSGEGGNLTSPGPGAGLGLVGRLAVSNSSNGPQLWASVFSTVALGVIGLTLVALVERIALRWHVSQRATTARTTSARASERRPARSLP
ncbi:ABC transporter permease subunit [soil metagenome]